MTKLVFGETQSKKKLGMTTQTKPSSRLSLGRIKEAAQVIDPVFTNTFEFYLRDHNWVKPIESASHVE